MKLTHLYATELADLVTPIRPVLPADTRLRMVNSELASQLCLPETWWQDNNLATAMQDEDFALCRQAVAQKYGGHQFGHWNPMLGDGRGLLLAEVEDSQGQHIDLHLKGAGTTPYSRQGDGRAVLRSTLREYIGSEALHHLGIPSSRALALFTSADTVYREQPETAAMMIRTAPSHIRFGHFEYYYHSQQPEQLKQLFDHVFIHHFPEVLKSDNPHLALLRTIVLRTARMIALWQVYGFVHGVMNTDNMSIHGITFDYGPYAFMDSFVSNAVFNHTDQQGRYAFDQQPGVGLWNLNALAHAFSDYCTTSQLRETLSLYEPTFIQQYQQMMVRRLGLDEPTERSLAVLNQLTGMLADQQRDYTVIFRQLALTDISTANPALRDQFIDRVAFDKWWESYRSLRMDGGETEEQQKLMCNINPAVIARTHHLQQVIEAAREDNFEPAHSLLSALRSPFSQKWDDSRWAGAPVNNSPVSLSCSS
ncbi:protein adenylyltransferase SelO [Salinimonas sediminis]|uniref:Protein nucleotidyltransferase YdiU n=1 Tax=Salinimonas sediminis TaxID=2303538 RepID=A0A346NRK5_9ALTE|nr:YdiU family protein [Salinimonas sediminis]AXR08162.1 YdiU family protein [Salinimonas sediminis]